MALFMSHTLDNLRHCLHFLWLLNHLLILKRKWLCVDFMTSSRDSSFLTVATASATLAGSGAFFLVLSRVNLMASVAALFSGSTFQF